MGIDPEQASKWPESKKLADAVMGQHAVVFTTGEGLRALLMDTPEGAERLAVDLQRHGERAWVVELEGDGEPVG